MQREYIELNPSLSASQAEVGKRILSSLLAEGLPPEAHEVYRGRNVVVSLDVEGLSLSPLNIKAFRRPHIVNRIIYGHLRQSKARRSFLNALTLLEKGFNTPMPIGMCEQSDGLLLGRSYYVCRHLAFPTLREVERSEQWPEIMDSLGVEMARLHREGVFFRDFSPGNILVEKHAGGYSFYYIDLNRMEFGVTSRYKLMNMFRAVIYYDPAMKRLAESYAVAMGLDPDSTAEEAFKRRHDFGAYLERKRALKARIKGRTK